MNKAYPAIVHEEEDGCWVEFPDLAGCFSDGETVADALANASEALGAYLCTLMDDGQDIPEPTAAREIHPAEGFASVVVTDPLKFKKNTKAVKKTLSIPFWMNEEAEKRNLNFSALLQKAILAQIN